MIEILLHNNKITNILIVPQILRGSGKTKMFLELMQTFLAYLLESKAKLKFLVIR